jgi:beta-aspartyl-peptidase (threonine type)
MEGKSRRAGSVASTTKIKNPISAARKVMENSGHVMLSGQGAN